MKKMVFKDLEVFFLNKILDSDDQIRLTPGKSYQ